jgi:hypothetical protein
MNARHLLASLLLAACTPAFAEGGCPAGMIPHQGTSVGSCAPIPTGVQGNDDLGPQWASRWGALAADPKNGVMGAVTDIESKRAAQKAAIQECLTRGGKKCKIEMVYRNQCVVTVEGSTASNHARAETVERAQQNGMDACKKRGDSDCHVYYQGCSLPVRVR